MLHVRFVLALIGLAISAGSLRSQTVDTFGDPLPPGAIGRLGALRFRVGGRALAVRFADEGKTLLMWSESAGNYLHRFDAGGGKELQRLATSRHGDWAVSPDGKCLAELDGNSITLRELLTGNALFEKETDDHSQLRCPQFSPDSKYLAAVLRRHGGQRPEELPVVIRMWEVAGGREVHTFVPPGDTLFDPRQITFSPDGRYLVAIGEETNGEINTPGVVRIWDTSGKTPARRLQSQAGGTRTVTFSPDCKRLAAWTKGTLRLWDPATGLMLKVLGEGADTVRGLAFSPDGRRLVVDGFPPQMWNVQSGESMSLPAPWALASSFSADGKTLALATGWHLILCDGTTGKLLHDIDHHIASGNYIEFYENAPRGMGWPIALSPDGSVVVAADEGGQLRRWQTATGKEILPEGGLTSRARALAFSPDGRRILAAGEELLLHDIDGSRVMRLALAKDEDIGGPPWPMALAFSSDAKRAAAGCRDGTVVLWDTGTGRRLWQRRKEGSEPGRNIWHTTFAPDDQTLVTLSERGPVLWWDAVTGHVRRTFQTFDRADRRWFLLSPAGRTAWAVAQGKVEEWELASGKLRCEFAAGAPLSLAADAHTLIAGDQHGFQLMDANWPTGFRLLHARKGNTRAVEISADGRMVAGVAGWDLVRFWDVGTATVRGEARGHDGGVYTLALAADGKTLATAAGDGTILLWRTPSLRSADQPFRLNLRPAGRGRVPAPRLPSSPLSGADLDPLWETLASVDARLAGEAMRRLLGHPDEAVALLREKLKPAAAPANDRLAELIAALDDPRLKVRDKSSAELAKLAERAEPALRRHLAGSPSTEQRVRIERLLTLLTTPTTDPAKLRDLRCIEILERLGTAEARAVLESMASGTETADVTHEARAALRRLQTAIP
jgi:WD40 repeat protein